MARQDRLGIFVALSREYGRADELTQAQVDAATRSYDLGLITEDTYLDRVAALLDLTTRERVA